MSNRTDRINIAVGVDIGGTKVAAGLVDDKGNILFHTRTPMIANGTASQGMEAVHTAIRAALDAARSEVAGIGVACPGPLDLPAGIVLRTPNLPCWPNFPLGDHVRREYGLTTHVDNDGNAAGLAEALWGAGAGFRSVFYVGMGTGIGAAIVLDRQLYRGRTGNAAEAGNMTVDRHAPIHCHYGKRGSIEGLASGAAIARRAREVATEEGPRSKMIELAGGNPAGITARTVEAACKAGDVAATKLMTEIADEVTVWLGDVVDLLDPDVIVMGGGAGKLYSQWFDYIREGLPQWTINERCREIPIKQAQYGADAGVAGAGALCFAEHPASSDLVCR